MMSDGSLAELKKKKSVNVLIVPIRLWCFHDYVSHIVFLHLMSLIQPTNKNENNFVVEFEIIYMNEKSKRR